MPACPEEIARSRHTAFGADMQPGAFSFLVSSKGACMEIDLTPGPDQSIALLRLRTVQVRLRFTAGDAHARSRLLAYSDLASHSGGG